jgi:hypothetical protein
MREALHHVLLDPPAKRILFSLGENQWMEFVFEGVAEVVTVLL